MSRTQLIDACDETAVAVAPPPTLRTGVGPSGVPARRWKMSRSFKNFTNLSGGHLSDIYLPVGVGRPVVDPQTGNRS